jgi:hypothetical protein
LGSDKRIDDLNPINNATWLQIFGVQYATRRLFGSAKHKSVPERESMEAMEIDRSKYVIEVWNDQVKFGQQFDLATNDFCVYPEFAGDSDEIFREHLRRQHACSCSPVLGNKLEGSTLLCGGSLIVRLNKDMGIEETTSAHESRHD